MKQIKGTQKLVVLSMLVSQALVLHIFERFIPVPVALPGVKLGLANVISLFTIIIFGWKEALFVVVLRTILASVFGGGVSSFLYSLSGGALSTLVMSFMYIRFRDYFSIPALSVTGAVFHNIGQLAVASLVVSNAMLFSYLPVLTISAVITGLFIGFAVKFTLRPLKVILRIGSE
ncbi:MAG: Gx transporter family protein [Bacillota bacterium]